MITYLALGIDSFVACLFVGPLLRGWRLRAGYAALFGLCDGFGTLLGAVVHHAMPDVPDVAVYAVAVALLVAGAMRSRAWLLALPALFALDNLAVGGGVSDAVASASASGLMAALGLALGVAAGRVVEA